MEATMRNKSITTTWVVAGLLAIGGVVGVSQSLPSLITQSRAAPASTTSAPYATVALPDFTGLVARCGPAVVNISVTQNEKVRNVMPNFQGLDPDDPFYQFF